MISVNLTTTFDRLDLCRAALTSLLLQSRLPDQINLWVSDGPYLRDKGIRDKNEIASVFDYVPRNDLNLIKVNWVENTGPYRKLIPALRAAAPEDTIVTADDDIFYGKNWLERLLDAQLEYGNAVIAARVRKKKVNFIGKETSYIFWDIVKEKQIVEEDYVVTFGGGAVLNKSMFREADIFDDAYMSVAPTADDLWYSKLLQLNGCKVIVIPELLKDLNFILHDDGLTNHNWPKASRFMQKLKYNLYDRTLGFWGIPVCGNDYAYRNINKYFREGKK